MGIENLARLLKKAKKYEPLARYTSFKIGGPAGLLFRAESADELERAVLLAQEEGIPWVVLGGGTNVLVADEGFPGLVVINKCGSIEREEKGDEVTLRVGSGVKLAYLACLTAREGWEGLEWAEGIPGTVGGAIVGNAGAFGGCMADVLKGVEILGDNGRKACLRPEELDFGYRDSAFKDRLRGCVILRAELKLARGEPGELRRRMLHYRRQRRARQPMEPSAGSVFKNPPGHYAGRLIEAVGLKGFRIGDACFSPVHANFIVNLGRAKASDVLSLMELAVEKVLREFGVKLEPELGFIGLNPPWS